MTDEIPAARRRSHRRAAAPSAPDPSNRVTLEVRASAVASPLDPPGTAAAEGDAPDATPAATPNVIRLERGGIDEAVADRVEVRMGGISRVRAQDVFVQWGGIGATRADRLGVEFGSVGAALAGDLRVSKGKATTVVARDARLEQSYVRTLIAGRVIAERPTGVLVMLARHVSGDIRPVLDWRGALAAGAAFGLVVSLVRGLRGRR